MRENFALSDLFLVEARALLCRPRSPCTPPRCRLCLLRAKPTARCTERFTLLRVPAPPHARGRRAARRRRGGHAGAWRNGLSPAAAALLLKQSILSNVLACSASDALLRVQYPQFDWDEGLVGRLLTVLPAFFFLALLAVVGADLHFRATGSENWAPLMLFLGALGLVVLAVRAPMQQLRTARAFIRKQHGLGRTSLSHRASYIAPGIGAQTLVYSCLQHWAGLEAAESAERLSRYREASQQRLYRGEQLEQLPCYDAATHTARGVPLYGATEQGNTVYTATVSPHTFVLNPAPQQSPQPRLPSTSQQPLRPGRDGTCQHQSQPQPQPQPQSQSLPPVQQIALPPLVLRVSEDGIAAGVPLYVAGSAQRGVYVEGPPRFRWEPPQRPLPTLTPALRGRAPALPRTPSTPSAPPPQAAPAPRALSPPPARPEVRATVPLVAAAAAAQQPQPSRRQWRGGPTAQRDFQRL